MPISPENLSTFWMDISYHFSTILANSLQFLPNCYNSYQSSIKILTNPLQKFLPIRYKNSYQSAPKILTNSLQFLPIRYIFYQFATILTNSLQFWPIRYKNSYILTNSLQFLPFLNNSYQFATILSNPLQKFLPIRYKNCFRFLLMFASVNTPMFLK